MTTGEPDGRRRILMLLGNNPYPGDPRVHPEATSLVAAGYDVTVICPRRHVGFGREEGAPQPRRETVDGVHVRRFRPAPRPRSFLGYVLDTVWVTAACLAQAMRVAFAQRVDAVHVHNPPDTLILVAAAFRAVGRPVIFDHHDLAPDLYTANSRRGGHASVRRVLETFERLSCRLADRIVTANASHRAVEVERCGVDPARIAIVRNGPDAALRPVGGARPDSVHPFTVGWLGVMSHHDGIDHLLRAVWELVDEHGMRDVRCVLLGNGGALEDCRRLVGQLGLEDRVEFPGFVPKSEIARRLSGVDVCAVPDPSNTYNDRCTMIKVMEYMALERPIVAYDLPETRVSAGDAAIYVAPNDHRAFARALATLAADPDRRRAMGRAGRRRVEEALAWSYSVPSLLAVYEDVLGGPGNGEVRRLGAKSALARA